MTNPSASRASWKSGKPPREWATGCEKLPTAEEPDHSAQPAKYLQRDRCGRTKPFSSAPRPKIWAPRGDRAPAAAPLRHPSPGDPEPSRGLGAGVGGHQGWGTQTGEEARRSAPPPGRRRAAGRPHHLRAPRHRCEAARNKGSGGLTPAAESGCAGCRRARPAHRVTWLGAEQRIKGALWPRNKEPPRARAEVGGTA